MAKKESRFNADVPADHFPNGCKVVRTPDGGIKLIPNEAQKSSKGVKNPKNKKKK